MLRAPVTYTTESDVMPMPKRVVESSTPATAAIITIGTISRSFDIVERAVAVTLPDPVSGLTVVGVADKPRVWGPRRLRFHAGGTSATCV